MPSFSKNNISASICDSFELIRINFNFNIIHGHQIKSSIFGALICLLINKPFIFTVHGSYTYLSILNKFLVFFVFLLSKNISFVNYELFRQYPLLYRKIIINKYQIVFNGIEIPVNYNLIDIYSKYSIPYRKK